MVLGGCYSQETVNAGRPGRKYFRDVISAIVRMAAGVRIPLPVSGSAGSPLDKLHTTILGSAFLVSV
jgi:hypothetical protein